MCSMAITDEQLGNAIRRIAAKLPGARGEDSFNWYAREMVKIADQLDAGEWTPEPVTLARVRMEPPDRQDGLAELVLELVLGKPASTGELRS